MKFTLNYIQMKRKEEKKKVDYMRNNKDNEAYQIQSQF